MPKANSRERKINVIYTYLDEIADTDELEERYIDSLLSMMWDYKVLAEMARKEKTSG